MSSRTAHLVIAQTKQVVKPSTKAKMLQQFRENFLNLNEALHVLLPDKWWPENVEAVTPLFIPFIMSKKCQEVVKFIPLYCVSFDKSSKELERARYEERANKKRLLGNGVLVCWNDLPLPEDIFHPYSPPPNLLDQIRAILSNNSQKGNKPSSGSIPAPSHSAFSFIPETKGTFVVTPLNLVLSSVPTNSQKDKAQSLGHDSEEEVLGISDRQAVSGLNYQNQGHVKSISDTGHQVPSIPQTKIPRKRIRKRKISILSPPPPLLQQLVNTEVEVNIDPSHSTCISSLTQSDSNTSLIDANIAKEARLSILSDVLRAAHPKFNHQLPIQPSNTKLFSTGSPTNASEPVGDAVYNTNRPDAPIMAQIDTANPPAAVSLPLQVHKSVPLRTRTGHESAYQNLIDSFDSTMDYHFGIHDTIKRTITHIRTSFGMTPSDVASLQEGTASVSGEISKVWSLAGGLTAEDRHWEFAQRYNDFCLQSFKTADESIGASSSPIPLDKRRRVERSGRLSYYSETRIKALEMSELPRSIFFDDVPEVDIHLAVGWDGRSALEREDYVDLSDIWPAIQDWGKVCDGSKLYLEEVNYLICEFVCYPEARLQGYLRSVFCNVHESIRKTCKESPNIDIFRELEKLPKESRKPLSLILGAVEVDWPATDAWRVQLRVGKGPDERGIGAVDVVYTSVMHKITTETIPHYYISENAPTKFIISVNPTNSLLTEKMEVEKIFIIQTRRPTAMEVANALQIRGSSTLRTVESVKRKFEEIS